MKAMAMPTWHNITHTISFYGACVLSSLLALHGLCGAQDERAAVLPLPSVEELLAGRNRPVRLTCELKGISRLPKDEIQPGLPAQPRESPQRRSYSIDFQNSLHRRTVEADVYLESFGFHTRELTTVFNGDVFKTLSPKDINRVLHSGKLRYNAELVLRKRGPLAFIPDREDLGVLFAAGELPRGSAAFGDVATLGMPVEPGMFVVVGRAVAEGQDCVVLQTTPRGVDRTHFEMWLAPALSNATVRASMRVHGVELFRIDLTYDSSSRPPSPTRMRYFSGDLRGLDLRGDLQFTKYDTYSSVPRGMFDIAAAPGMIVQNIDTNEWHRVGYAGQRPVPVRELASQESRGTGKVRIVAVLLFTTLGAGGIALAWALRRLRRA